jgi:orotidine-5'-phosphate decarboxylase
MVESITSRIRQVTPRDRLIFALDVPTSKEALSLARRLSGHVGFFKIGLELFVASGPDLVGRIRRYAPVFLDLKLHDIPATVERAAKAAAGFGASYLTIHVDETGAAISQAVDAAPSVSILGVTVLTSVSERDLGPNGFSIGLADLVRLRAGIAYAAGCGGIVCSGHEVAEMKAMFGHMEAIVPGIRSQGGPEGDQKRVVTASQAIRNGADRIVVGRPIRDAADPVAASDAFVREIAEASGTDKGMLG